MREQVFWGWGEPGAGPSLPEAAAALLRERFGVTGAVVSRPVALADVRLPESALDPAVRARLVAITGAAAVRDDREQRVLRAAGKAYADLVALRSGDAARAPDAVVAPADAAQVQAILEACAGAGVAVIPFGGGTSVTGGVTPERGGCKAAISLDLGRLDRVLAIDERSLTARLAPGLRLPEAEHVLGARGLSLAHFPQSFEWATVGGCVATRSAGQTSTGQGRIDANVLALRCATPAGPLGTLDVPASAAGPSVREVVVGSEGALGVITEVTLRVRPAPASVRYEGWFLRSFPTGLEALRDLAQREAAPDLARLSDEAETALSVALTGGGLEARLGAGWLRARGYAGGCLLVVGWEGEAERVARRRAVAARALRAAGGLAVGRGAGEAWRAARYAGPHLRDDLLDRGVLVETLETAASWSRLETLHGAVRAALGRALAARGTPAHVGAHVSHVYTTGASLYFTVLARQDAGDPLGQWAAAKTAATRAIVEAGATISHHHGVGRDHASWLPEETGPLGLDVLRAVKERCDPTGVMNPGVLLRREAA